MTHTSDTTVYHSRLIYPFQGLRPQTESVDEVAAPPYDVLSSSEARLLAHDKPLSFLHISKPEIDLQKALIHFLMLFMKRVQKIYAVCLNLGS